jgi:hypothetical protein
MPQPNEAGLRLPHVPLRRHLLRLHLTDVGLGGAPGLMGRHQLSPGLCDGRVRGAHRFSCGFDIRLSLLHRCLRLAHLFPRTLHLGTSCFDSSDRGIEGLGADSVLPEQGLDAALVLVSPFCARLFRRDVRSRHFNRCLSGRFGDREISPGLIDVRAESGVVQDDEPLTGPNALIVSHQHLGHVTRHLGRDRHGVRGQISVVCRNMGRSELPQAHSPDNGGAENDSGAQQQ